MLIQVNVQNFKSFNELNSLNLIASNKLRKQKERHVTEHIGRGKNRTQTKAL